ncbi:MAG: DNA polymerase IV [Bacteroidetes bacterium]|nr:DNA polymerase IV [Bacteroidota bacterium]MBK9425174.1 DNA polymerase IV [Bacteroidota bacterium]
MRHIVHLDLDSFFVSVERLQNSSLVGKPILIGGNSDRAVVSSCSYEARKYGVSSAMPMRMAKMLCPDAIIVRGDMEVYSKYSNMVTDIIDEDAPLYEKASIDEHYIDITGMDRFHGSLKWTSELRQRIIRETGLPISFGMSPNKTVSKIATNEAKPSGQLEVEQERVKPFLNPLSISKIPMLGQKSYHLLRNMGVAIIETLGAMPVEMMIRVLGENGRSIWEKANGIDNAPVVPYTERKSISTERTFEKDTIDIVKINELLVTMVEGLTYDLRKQKRLTSCITVKIRYSNFDTHTMQARIPYTASDHVLIARARELFKKLYERRMLIRLVGIRLSHLVQGHPQINLFEDSTEMVNLYQAIDRLKNRYGEGAVIRGVGIK